MVAAPGHPKGDVHGMIYPQTFVRGVKAGVATSPLEGISKMGSIAKLQSDPPLVRSKFVPAGLIATVTY
jgi:hypothetical protein